MRQKTFQQTEKVVKVIPNSRIWRCVDSKRSMNFIAYIYRTSTYGHYIEVGGWSYDSIGGMFMDWDIPDRRILIEKTGFFI